MKAGCGYFYGIMFLKFCPVTELLSSFFICSAFWCLCSEQHSSNVFRCLVFCQNHVVSATVIASFSCWYFDVVGLYIYIYIYIATAVCRHYFCMTLPKWNNSSRGQLIANLEAVWVIVTEVQMLFFSSVLPLFLEVIYVVVTMLIFHCILWNRSTQPFTLCGTVKCVLSNNNNGSGGWGW